MAVGCCLYLATGMIFGVIFQIGFAKLGEPSTLSRRLLLATGMGLILWLVNFYCVLSWLQPMLFNGRWIVDLVPWKVAAATHIVFAWTMALVYPLGAYRPYYRQSEK